MNNSQGDQLGLTLAYTIVIVELCVDLVGLPISSLNFYAIYKTSVRRIFQDFFNWKCFLFFKKKF